MILISFLGTTEYKATTYLWQEKQVHTAYTVAACSDFLQPDEIIVFATKEAYEKNWSGLCDALQAVEMPEPEFREIPLGKNESELWQIFNDLMEAIPSDTEIAVDLTNGQRSLPAVVILASVFMKTGLNIKVKHLLYGAFQVDPSEKDISPMFDLSSMLDLVNWGIAAERFNRDGDSEELANLFTDFAKEYAKTHQGEERENGHMLRKLAEDLTEISQSYLLLRPQHVRFTETKLRENISKAKDALTGIPEQKPLQMLLDRLEMTYIPQEISGCSEGEEMLIRERDMIQWYRERGHLMQAVSLAREWLLTWLMVQDGIDSSRDLDNGKLREAYNGKLNGASDDRDQDGAYSEEERRERLQAAREAQKLPDQVDRTEFFTLYDTMGDIRNDLMHAGKRKTPGKPKNIFKTANKQIDLLMKLPIREETK